MVAGKVLMEGGLVHPDKVESNDAAGTGCGVVQGMLFSLKHTQCEHFGLVL